MKISEFKKLIREEVRRVVKEMSGNSLDYRLFTVVPKQTLQALSKYTDTKNIKPAHEMNMRSGGKKLYTIKFTADSDLKKILANAPFDKLIDSAVTTKAGSSPNNNKTSDIEDYFLNYDVQVTSTFNLASFAEYIQQNQEDAETLLLNLEDEKVMNDIAKGNYETFDMFEPTQFNDEYEQMMDDLGIETA